MLAHLPPDTAHVSLVGFLKNDNGRSCDNHPGGCGNALVWAAPNRGIGLTLQLRLVAPTQLALYTINLDGTDGCRVGFTKALYASRRGHILNGKYVQIIDVYHEEHENVTCRAEHHHNCGFAHREVLDQAQQDAFLSQLHQQYRQEMDAQMEG